MLKMKFTKSVHPTKNGMTYDIDGGDSILIFSLATKLQKEFGLDARRFPAFGFDEVLVELTKEDIEIIAVWDIFFKNREISR